MYITESNIQTWLFWTLNNRLQHLEFELDIYQTFWKNNPHFSLTSLTFDNHYFLFDNPVWYKKDLPAQNGCLHVNLRGSQAFVRRTCLSQNLQKSITKARNPTFTLNLSLSYYFTVNLLLFTLCLNHLVERGKGFIDQNLMALPVRSR